ncbi:NADH dehydrogenase subunit E [Cribrihabitans marinus]|nr:NADH dehydrogenase subunit E [Cribrihabitans marinus]
MAGALVILAAALLWAGMAHAKPPLREVEEIDNELYYIAIANEIDKRCDAISGRRFKAINVMWGLKRKANDLGYSDAEIRAYVDSDAEKARMRRKGEAYLSANGVGDRKPESFCALGRAEIKRNSAIGVYLRAK